MSSPDDARAQEDLSGFVAGSDVESSVPGSPDLMVNPIMDVEQEDEAIMTNEDEDEDEDRDESESSPRDAGSSKSGQEQGERESGRRQRGRNKFNCLPSEAGSQEESTKRDTRRYLHQGDASGSITRGTIKASYKITGPKIVITKEEDY